MAICDRVQTILRTTPAARDSDELLYLLYVERYRGKVLSPEQRAFVLDFLLQANLWSLERARRKIQEKFPELGPTSPTVRDRRRRTQ